MTAAAVPVPVITPVPVPGHDLLSLPGPAWLLSLCAFVLLYLHVVFVGMVVGGAVFLFVRRLTRHHRGDLDRRLDIRLVKTLPVCLSLAVTFGVGAYVFVSCLYHPYLYSANIFIASYWMLILLLLLLAFVTAYLAARFQQRPAACLFLTLLPLALLAVLYIMTNSALLTIQPEHWLAFHRGLARIHVPDPVSLPRLLHNFGAVLVIAGLAVAWIGRFRSAASGAAGTMAPDQPQLARHAARTGARWLLVGLVLQGAFGLWYLLALPAPIRARLTHFATPAALAWSLALALFVVTLFTALRILQHPARRLWLILSTILPALGLIGMLLARQQLRTDYLARDLAGSFDIHNSIDAQHGWVVQSQPSAILAFLIVVVAGLLLLTLMLLLLRRRPAPPAAPPRQNPPRLSPLSPGSPASQTPPPAPPAPPDSPA